MKDLIAKADVLIEALPYIQAFRGSIVVVKFGGSIMEDPARIRDVLEDIVFMECAGMQPVVIHGGGKAITAALAREGIETRFINGLRYTCDRAIRVVDRVLHQTVNASLVTLMNEMEGRAQAVSGKDVLRARRIATTDRDTGEELDLGFVGEVVNVDTEQLGWILARNQVPVIAPLGCDMAGSVYNINADMAACEIAGALKARKLVFLSDVPGILRRPDDSSSLISTIRVSEVEELIQGDVIKGGMVPKVRSAVSAIRAGTQQVHMIGGNTEHSLLLEFFTRKGIGTQIINGDERP